MYDWINALASRPYRRSSSSGEAIEVIDVLHQPEVVHVLQVLVGLGLGDGGGDCDCQLLMSERGLERIVGGTTSDGPSLGGARFSAPRRASAAGQGSSARRRG